MAYNPFKDEERRLAKRLAPTRTEQLIDAAIDAGLFDLADAAIEALPIDDEREPCDDDGYDSQEDAERHGNDRSAYSTMTQRLGIRADCRCCGVVSWDRNEPIDIA